MSSCSHFTAIELATEVIISNDKFHFINCLVIVDVKNYLTKHNFHL